MIVFFFFFQAEDGIRDIGVTGVQTCALPIYLVHHTSKCMPYVLSVVFVLTSVLPYILRFSGAGEIGRASCRERV